MKYTTLAVSNPEDLLLNLYLQPNVMAEAIFRHYAKNVAPLLGRDVADIASEVYTIHGELVEEFKKALHSNDSK